MSSAAEAKRCTLFPRVDADEVAACVRRRPSRPLTASVATLAALADCFEGAWAGPVHVGFNPASGCLSLSVPLEAHPSSGGDPALRAVVEGLLGVSDEARSREASWATWKASAESGEAAAESWANVALGALERATGLCVCDRTVHAHTGAVVLTLALPFDEGPRPAQFRYCPAYLTLLPGVVHEGYDVGVSEQFWEGVERAHYLCGDGLRRAVTPILRGWVASSVTALGQRRGFRPRAGEGATNRLYLWGPPGVGKSEFVKVMGPALEAALRGSVDPGIKVEVVKVQLNALTRSEFRGASRVKGISDMSIERVCGQSLDKGHVVVLHFEENPEEEGTQDELYECGEELLRALLGGKGMAGGAGLVWVVTTSNYPPSNLVRGRLEGVEGAACVQMETTGDAEAIRAWAVRRLAAAVTKAMPDRHVSVSVSPDFPCRHAVPVDLRSLGTWWNTLAFHAVQACTAVDESTERERGDKGNGDSALSPLAVHFDVDTEGHCAVRASSSGAAGAGVVRLHTEDGNFWMAAPPLDGRTELPERVVQVLWMHRLNWLRPAVVAVRGAPERQAEVAAAIEDLVRTWATAGPQFAVKRVALELRTEADKVRLFGSNSSVQGGLFAWIAGEVNGGHMQDESILGVVVLRVTHEGQFAARELLEASQSRTHRLAVRKDRLLFLVLPLGDDNDLEGTAEKVLQPPLLSRCHVVV